MADRYAVLICDEAPITVVLTDAGSRPIEVVKLLHRRVPLSLWEAKALIGRLPAVILDDVVREVAESMVRELLGAGAQAEVRPEKRSWPVRR